MKKIISCCGQDIYEQGRSIGSLLRRVWGPRAFFWRDAGLRAQGIYGQVCEPKKLSGGNSCLTGRVQITGATEADYTAYEAERTEAAYRAYASI